MININSIIEAVRMQIDSNVEVSKFKSQEVSKNEFINEDPNRVPWIGVYKGPVRYEPRTLGKINNWESFPSIRVIVQESDLYSSEACSERLDGHVKDIINALISDYTLAGTVDMINTFDVDYRYIETDRMDMAFQSAIITFNLEVMTQ